MLSYAGGKTYVRRHVLRCRIDVFEGTVLIITPFLSLPAMDPELAEKTALTEAF